MADEILYFSNIKIFGVYVFQGCDEIKGADKVELAGDLRYKITYENGCMTKLETQRNSVTVDAFPSFPAFIYFLHGQDSITITFADSQNVPKRYRNIETCVLKATPQSTASTAAEGAEYTALFYTGGKRVADEEGIYEIVYRFADAAVSRIIAERYLGQNGRPVELRGIDWKGVECGSPGPESYYYYSAVQYGYDDKNELMKEEYLNAAGTVMYMQSVKQ
ncbi:MAG: hypothetical protein EHM28_02325 [Spirochaetaceae bacterium]|nr:MAG: hypothetical protein EHM28_02325 [Spirochaetaceae bacterium]